MSLYLFSWTPVTPICISIIVWRGIWTNQNIIIRHRLQLLLYIYKLLSIFYVLRERKLYQIDKNPTSTYLYMRNFFQWSICKICIQSSQHRLHWNFGEKHISSTSLFSIENKHFGSIWITWWDTTTTGALCLSSSIITGSSLYTVVNEKTQLIYNFFWVFRRTDDDHSSPGSDYTPLYDI